MPEKKAAKKVAKKAAKKAPGRPDPKKGGKEIRRAYEHLGRVQTIGSLLSGEDRDPVKQLVDASEGALRAGHSKAAADLLRAAEHLAFASLQRDSVPEHHPSGALLEAVHDEFQHLCTKAEDHGEAAEAPAPIQKLYKQLRSGAEKRLKERRFRAALEMARAAEALTHLGPMAGQMAKGEALGYLDDASARD